MPHTEYFSREYLVMECDCDMNENLTPGAFLRLAQQISGQHCNTLGMTGEFYRRQHAVFLLAKLAMHLERPIKSGEVLTLRTMPETAKRAVYKRVTAAFDQQGERVALLDSRWVLVDTETRRILRRPPEAFASLPFEESVPFELDVSIRKPEQTQPAGAVCAAYSRCDTNKHMNNTRYADAAADALPLEAFENGAVVRHLVISYHNELPMGQTAQLERGRLADGSWYVAGQREGRPCFEAVLTVG